MLIVTIFVIANSYAKYIAEASGTTERQAGAWAIKVNDTDISSSSSETEFKIDKLTYKKNDYVEEGKIAPSSVGYFDVTIDPSGTSTAVRFDVNIDTTELGISDAINFTDAKLVVDGVESDKTLTRTAEKTYSGIISLDDVQKGVLTTARFYVKWDDEETTLCDKSDSQIGSTKDVSLGLPIVVVVSQYLGETLEEYK